MESQLCPSFAHVQIANAISLQAGECKPPILSIYAAAVVLSNINLICVFHTLGARANNVSLAASSSKTLMWTGDSSIGLGHNKPSKT